MGDLSHLFYGAATQAAVSPYNRSLTTPCLFLGEKSVARYRNALNSFNRDMSMCQDPEGIAGLSMICLIINGLMINCLGVLTLNNCSYSYQLFQNNQLCTKMHIANSIVESSWHFTLHLDL